MAEFQIGKWLLLHELAKFSVPEAEGPALGSM